ncbi:transporter substrate-binding domain-containing protein [Mesorhizobium sp. CAU 1741]|uniref:transporter substrate-binding domain-containing protein n=1 Tax=Mesorhizobium sp. CAU 1741 TaxID=3140366 RepID=UPI00325BABCB
MLALSIFAGGVLGASADVLSDVTQRGTIRIAVPEDFPPYGAMGLDMKPTGYDVDVANYVAEKLGVSLELVPVIGSNRIPSLQTDKVDLIISVLGKSPEREAVIDFANAYGVLNNSVFAEEDSGIAEAADLAGKSVSVLRGGIADMLITEIAPATSEIKRYEDETSNTQAFLSGQVDAIATGDIIINALKARSPRRMPEEMFILNTSPLYVGVKKGESTMIAKVNEIIAKMIADGTLESISQKWLGRGIPDKM